MEPSPPPQRPSVETADTPRTQQLKDLRQKRLAFYTKPSGNSSQDSTPEQCNSPRQPRVIKMRPIPILGGQLPVVPRPPSSDKPAVPPKPSPETWGAVITVPIKRHRGHGHALDRSTDVLRQLEPTTCSVLPFQLPMEGFRPSPMRGSYSTVTDVSSRATTPRYRTEQFRFSMDSSLSGLETPRGDTPRTDTPTGAIPRADQEGRGGGQVARVVHDITEAQFEMDYTNLGLSDGNAVHKEAALRGELSRESHGLLNRDPDARLPNNPRTGILSDEAYAPSSRTPPLLDRSMGLSGGFSGESPRPPPARHPPALLDREELERTAVAVSAEDFQVDVDVGGGLTLPSLESVLGRDRYERLMRNIEEIESDADDDDIDGPVDSGEIARQIWKDSPRDTEVSTLVGRPLKSGSSEEEEEGEEGQLGDDLGLETHRPEEEAAAGAGEPILQNTTPKERYMPEEAGLERNYQQDKVKVAFSADQIYARASHLYQGDSPGAGGTERYAAVDESYSSNVDQFSSQFNRVSLDDDQSEVTNGFDTMGRGGDSIDLESRAGGRKADNGGKADPGPHKSTLSERQLEHMDRIRSSVESRKPDEVDYDVVSDILSGRSEATPSFPYAKDEVERVDFPVHRKTSDTELPPLPLSKPAVVNHDDRSYSHQVAPAEEGVTFRDDESIFTTVSTCVGEPPAGKAGNQQHLNGFAESAYDLLGGGDGKGIATVKDIHKTVQTSGVLNGLTAAVTMPPRSAGEPCENPGEQNSAVNQNARFDRIKPLSGYRSPNGSRSYPPRPRRPPPPSHDAPGPDVPGVSAESIEDSKFVYDEPKMSAAQLPNHLKVELSINLASSVETTTTTGSTTDTPETACGQQQQQPKHVRYMAYGSSSAQGGHKAPDVGGGREVKKHKRKSKRKPLPTDSSEDIKFEYADDTQQRRALPAGLSCELSLNLRDSMDSETAGPSRPPANPPIEEGEETPRAPAEEALAARPASTSPGSADPPEDAVVVSSDYQEFVKRLMEDSRFQTDDAPRPSAGVPRPSKSRVRPLSAGNVRRSELSGAERKEQQTAEPEPYRQRWTSSTPQHLAQARQSKPGARARPSSAKVSTASVNFLDDGSGAGANPRASSNLSNLRGRPSSADKRNRRNVPSAKSIDSAAFIEHVPKKSKSGRPDLFTIQSVPYFKDKAGTGYHHRENDDSYSKYMQLTPRIHSGELSFMLCLPDEVLLEIFSYLPHADLFNCVSVCQHFKRVGLDYSLWKNVMLKRRPVTNEMLEQIGKRRPVSLSLIQCRGSRVTEVGLRELFRHCADSLQELNVTGCSNGGLTGDNMLLHAANRCTGLASVDVSWCNINDPGLLAVVEISQGLHTVCVNGCQSISDESIHALATKHGIYLHTLELFGCFNVTARALVSIGSYCKSLRTLNLGQCWKVTDTAVGQLSYSLGQVVNLDLRGCKQLVDATVALVLRNCPTLETLALANCPNLTDSTLQEIAVHGANLKSLDVCGCKKMTSLGTKALAMNCTQLNYLDLSSTAVTHKGVSSVASYSHRKLEVLKVNFCKPLNMSCLIRLVKNCRKLRKLYIYGVTTIRNTEEIQNINPDLWIEK